MHCLDNALDNWAINGLTRELSQGIESKRVNVWTDHEKNTTTVIVSTNFITNVTRMYIFFGPIKSRLMQNKSV